MNSKDVGDVSVSAVLARLVKNNKHVLLPFGDNLRHDLAIDEEGKFSRIQIKTARLKKNKLIFNTCSSTFHRRNGTLKDYQGEIEFFGVYSRELDKVYLIPINKVQTKREATLLLSEPKRKNSFGVRFAKDFEI